MSLPMLSIIDFIIFALPLMSSRRVSPGSCPRPAVMTITSACPASQGDAQRIEPGVPASSRSRTSPRHLCDETPSTRYGVAAMA